MFGTGMLDEGEVWRLVIRESGIGGEREFHRSIHASIESVWVRADEYLGYDVPELDEWYESPANDEFQTKRCGYVLSEEEIDRWPIRIEAKRMEVLALGCELRE